MECTYDFDKHLRWYVPSNISKCIFIIKIISKYLLYMSFDKFMWVGKMISVWHRFMWECKYIIVMCVCACCQAKCVKSGCCKPEIGNNKQPHELMRLCTVGNAIRIHSIYLHTHSCCLCLCFCLYLYLCCICYYCCFLVTH